MNNQANDINSIDDIDLRYKKWHKLRERRVYAYPSVLTDQEEYLDLFKDFKAVVKGPVNKFFENFNLLLGNLGCHRYFNFRRLRSAKQIMLVDLGEFNLFQFAQSCLRPADTFVCGLSGHESVSGYETTAFYEQFASYNALKAAQSVEICVPRLERGRLAFFDEVYSYLNTILDPVTKIIVLSKSPGVLRGELVLNERGRYVQSVCTLTLEGQMPYIECLLT